MLWRLIQTLCICLLSTFGFFILLLMDYEWESALLAAVSFAAIVTLLYFFIYQRGYRAIIQEMVATCSLVVGYWVVFYSITRASIYPTAFLNFLLVLGLLLMVAPFIVLGILSFQLRSRPRAFRNPHARDISSNTNRGGTNNSDAESNGDIQEEYLNRRYGADRGDRGNHGDRGDRGDPDAFKRLEDPYFPSQAYEWFWVNPLILALGIAPGFILALLFGLMFGWRGIVPGFGIGLLTIAAVQAWLVWNR